MRQRWFGGRIWQRQGRFRTRPGRLRPVLKVAEDGWWAGRESNPHSFRGGFTGCCRNAPNEYQSRSQLPLERQSLAHPLQ